MDVLAAEGTSPPGIRLRNRPTQVMPIQRKVHARRKRRKELVLIQICLFGGLLLLVKGFSYLAEHSGFHVSSHSSDGQERWGGRRLLQETDNSSLEDEDEEDSKNCTAPALHEFPTDLFTNKERTEGAVALHVLCLKHASVSQVKASMEPVCRHSYRRNVPVQDDPCCAVLAVSGGTNCNESSSSSAASPGNSAVHKRSTKNYRTGPRRRDVPDIGGDVTTYGTATL